ncbi:thioredoxin family protein [Hydrogenimonas cancrithermarum]|uniref:DUF255 domain-containing protein n=1 Tax=Hydrogenimonas cancrithermarum TaxID=2993563 RepID=A0ABN6WZ71_9BACT|nr:thioredoxin family protein [Hydrogenimonas cancrithermarum]BDY13650.1 hypothetical protein HCR_19620 [Hydrogenimonas cancrithermarum]
MMQRTLATLLLTIQLFADTIQWMGSFDKALVLAQQSGKPMLVVLVTRECGACRELFATTFRDKDVVDLVNEKTIAVIVTEENEDYPIELLYTLVYPTLFLLSPQEVFLKEPLRGTVDASLLKEKFLNE